MSISEREFEHNFPVHPVTNALGEFPGDGAPWGAKTAGKAAKAARLILAKSMRSFMRGRILPGGKRVGPEVVALNPRGPSPRLLQDQSI
jgi:hypothetical protein